MLKKELSLNKILILSFLSLLGILSPIIGVVLGAISIKMVKNFNIKNKEVLSIYLISIVGILLAVGNFLFPIGKIIF